MKPIILENELFRLEIGPDCIARSLTICATGEEMLQQGEEISLFSVTQERPFNNEVKLAYPNKRTTFQANRVRMEEDRLIIGFEIAPFEAVLRVKLAPRYIAFALERFIVHPTDYEGLAMTPPPVAELRMLQLPVRERANFGQWLNVSWDESAAVNVLAACPHARIDSERRKGWRVLSADAVRGIRLEGCEAAIIACPSEMLMDCIAAFEEDYGLPRGVESRRGDRINASAYHSGDITPLNVDEHIRYAKMGGFRMMLVYYPSIFKTFRGYGYNGDYDFREEYPNGIEDLRAMLEKIKAAGITPGLHFLHTHIGLWSRYVTPVADHRLNLTRHFTLARPLSMQDTTVYVEQNPLGCVMDERCRILQFGGELISYSAYTTEPPYCFTGCARGDHGTNIVEHPLGQIGGLLDVSEFGAVSVYLDQNSGLQEEVGQKLAQAYNAGFEFVYFDGSEGTNEPFAYHVPNAQYRVWKLLDKPPIYCEGAAKAHFSWHFLSGGNAFDIFPPPVFKEKIAQFPAEEAPRMRQDFTRLNFGWWGYWAPGTQPDMLEYGTSRAAAWDCPVTITTTLERYRAHPRTPDNLEVMRRWEEARMTGWLSPEQKEALKDLEQEHILLINEDREFELLPYRQISACDGVRAFLFTRAGKTAVVFWHESGEGTLRLPLAAEAELREELYAQPLPLLRENGALLLPVSGRRYLLCDAPCEKVEAAFASSALL
ncbi:MAG: hypothetical protein Q4A66_08180 [Eubacteriales bacterium]|nr:hypothetical protein [Eubacteriales bacterium]